MSFEHIVAIASLTVAIIALFVSIGGFIVVFIQLRSGNKHRESASLSRVIDANRQLITLAFSHPELLAVLKDQNPSKPGWEHFYLQLWLNEFSMAHAFIKHSFFQKERRENLARGIAAFMRKSNMQRHWEDEAKYYPPSFQQFVNEILKKIEPPQLSQAAAQVKP